GHCRRYFYSGQRRRMREELAKMREEALLKVAGAHSLSDLEKVRIHYLGRKGSLTSLLRELGSLPMEIRPEVGRQANLLKVELEEGLRKRAEEIKAREREELEARGRIDITLPGWPAALGSLHPLTLVFQEIIQVFSHLGFEIAEGPEVELDYYNFEALNLHKDHPARDMQDTFYISDEVLLRTHTSPVQIRVMEKYQPPLRVIAPGRVYRRDDDISHTPMFHQVEGFLVDEAVSFADLKGILEIFIGPAEAQAIAIALNQQSPPRPLSYDLMLSILEALKVRVKGVFITDLRENIYYALLRLQAPAQELSFDSRPSDAIAMALRAGAPIWVETRLLKQPVSEGYPSLQ
ncbi:MAG: DUF151 domain-containing protein, partial [candidate division NC10 bacterium]|nr:DUF151 domain-containing protein [candidate division NC10 bacterium]